MVSEARRLAAKTFASWGMDPDQTELACLLVSEVVTNAVLHASVTPTRARLDFDLDPVTCAPCRRVRPRAGPRPGRARRRSGNRRPGPHGAGPASGCPAGRAWGGPRPVPSRSARREFALRLRRGANAVWVEVFDADLRLPRIRTAGETDEGGRGLYLVEQLATRWGSRPTPEGKAVWFEMPRSVSRSLAPARRWSSFSGPCSWKRA